MTKAKTGDKVMVTYLGTLDDGSVFDSSLEPLEFEIGEKMLLPLFENSLIGMEKMILTLFCLGRSQMKAILQ